MQMTIEQQRLLLRLTPAVVLVTFALNAIQSAFA